MKKLFLAGFVAALLFAPALSLAQPYNPVVDDGSVSPAGVFLGFGFMAIFFILGIAAFAIWIWMLVHAATHSVPHQIVWVIVIALTGIIGALIYYFVVKRKFVPAPQASAPSSPASPPESQ